MGPEEPLQKSRSPVSTKTPLLLCLALPQRVSFTNVVCDLYSTQMFCEVYCTEHWSLINVVRKHYIFLVGSLLDLTLVSQLRFPPQHTRGFVVLAGAGTLFSPDNRGRYKLDGGRRRKRSAPACFLFPSASPQQCFLLHPGSITGSILICFSHRPRPRS